jgi:uncharacterized protein YecT (DUF1311 family)
MRFRISSSLALAATLTTVVLAASAPAHPLSAHVAKLSPPVVRESFTPLGCTGSPGHRSTIEQEGCAEQQILKTDQQINGLNRTVFTKLADDAARRRFVAGHRAWLKYRHAYCLSLSDVFEGGTDAAVVDATCVAGVNTQHVKDLKAFVSDLSSN